MIYDYFKILHIISATLLLTSIVVTVRDWRILQVTQSSTAIRDTIQTRTWFSIIPLALIQLLSGFTMISLHHEMMTQVWVKGSVSGFIIAITSWLYFVYSTSFAQLKRTQLVTISICLITLFCMIFLMASKIP